MNTKAMTWIFSRETGASEQLMRNLEMAFYKCQEPRVGLVSDLWEKIV
jgi:hypothetical protein